MSTYEHEQGNIHFTKTGYMQFIRLMRKEINDHLNRLYKGALAAHEELAKIKGRGATEKQKAKFEEFFGYPRRYAGHGFFRSQVDGPYSLRTKAGDVPVSYNHKYWLKQELFRGTNGKLTKPRKNTLPLLNNKQASFSLDCDDGGFNFDERSLSARWLVDENNHAVQDAHASVGYSLFSKAISAYTWKRKEGGTFYYGSEYTREGAIENGMPVTDSVSCSFGPEGERERFQSLGYSKKEIDKKVREFMDKQKRTRR